jgi:hypothetical protein
MYSALAESPFEISEEDVLAVFVHFSNKQNLYVVFHSVEFAIIDPTRFVQLVTQVIYFYPYG